MKDSHNPPRKRGRPRAASKESDSHSRKRGRLKTPPSPPGKRAKQTGAAKSVDSTSSTSSRSPSSDAAGHSSRLTLTELLECACGKCVNCLKDDCGRCASCTSSTSRTQVCVQKMCCQVPEEQKAQPMPASANFPSGWYFIVDPTLTLPSHEKPQGVRGLKIIPPAGAGAVKWYYSLEAAMSHRSQLLRDVNEDEFHKYIGDPGKEEDASSVENDNDLVVAKAPPRHRQRAHDKPGSPGLDFSNDHPLVGKNYCLKWAGLDQINKVIFGQVTACEVHHQTGAVQHLQVTYTPESRELANAMGNSCGLKVAESQMLTPEMALGGCIECEKTTQSDESSSLLEDFPTKFHWTWINPDYRYRELIANEDGKNMPRLSLVVRCFRLILNVKPSNIPNAGNGVFMSCRPLAGNCDKYLTLKPGELMDVGVYAPFRPQDVRRESLVFAKNFVFNNKCGKFAIDSLDSRFLLDITDDCTADLHETAASHVTPYTNETGDYKTQTVYAQHDPEGCVHFLVGHGAEDQGDFVLPADGSEVELLLHYGATYAKERRRNGYSFDEEGSDDEHEIVTGDLEYIEELNKCECGDIEGIIEFLLATFVADKEARFETTVTERALVCAAVIQRRVYHKLRDSGEDAQRLFLLLRNAGRVIALLLNVINEDGTIKKLQSESATFDPDLVLWEVFKQCLPADLCLQLKDII